MSERASRLKDMLAQTSPGGTVESVLDERPRVASTAALEAFGETAASQAEDHVRSGLEKMARGEERQLTPEEMDTLEAIVMPENRPVAFVRNSGYDPLGGVWVHLNDQAVRERVTPLLASIGRIELPNATYLPYGGTGFIVGPGLLMTNRHVARLFADGIGTRVTYNRGEAAINFHRWVDSDENDRAAYLEVVKVEMIHPFWDVAILRVDGMGNQFTPLTLSTQPPEELVDRDVVAVGYPARDDRSDLALQDRIFGAKYNVKRFQPGKLKIRERIRSFENTVNAVTHDSSTLGGNSGSAVLDIATGEVVGLHFAGVYLKANYAVPTYELARDSRVVATGLNFRGSVPGTDEWGAAWRRAGAIESSEPDAQNPRPDPGPRPAPPVQAVSRSGPASVTFTVPLNITVSIGELALAGSRAEIAMTEVEAPHLQVPIIYGGLEHRTGYQDSFLELDHDVRIPLPELTPLGETVLARLEDGSCELKYHRFSVVMHRGRRLALFTASNVDWRSEMRTINGQKPSRGKLTGIPDDVSEEWVPDWRIPAEHQLPDLFFTRDQGAFDKGHIVRRDDVCWGATFEEMQKANGDTFHTTNCSPQIAAFNRSTLGEDNWGDLEDLIAKQTRAEKAVIFAGPVLADDDRRFKGRDQTGTVRVQIPRRFWKIIVVKGADGPRAYGFVLEQDLSATPLELAVPSAWQVHMRRISEIETLLNGLARIPWLVQFDAYDSTEGVSMQDRLG